MTSFKKIPRWIKILGTFVVLVIIGFAISLTNEKPKTPDLPFDPSVLKIDKTDTVVIHLPYGEKLTSLDSINGDYETSKITKCIFCGLNKKERDSVQKKYDEKPDTVGRFFDRKDHVVYLYVEHNLKRDLCK